MKKIFLFVLMPVALISFAFGCTRVRTYTLEEKRPDQNMRSGNSGYFAGKPSEEELNRPRKLTRKNYVAEIEIGSYKTAPKKTNSQGMVVETVQEPAGSVIAETTEQEAASKASVEKMTSYTVLANDSLGKISQKVYGSAKKWKKIFEANSGQLKSPDKIYAGQVLKIPQE